jgi:hypothetical protein
MAEWESDGLLRGPFKDHITGWLAAWVLRQRQGVTVMQPALWPNWVKALAKCSEAETHG